MKNVNIFWYKFKWIKLNSNVWIIIVIKIFNLFFCIILKINFLNMNFLKNGVINVIDMFIEIILFFFIFWYLL